MRTSYKMPITGKLFEPQDEIALACVFSIARNDTLLYSAFSALPLKLHFKSLMTIKDVYQQILKTTLSTCPRHFVYKEKTTSVDFTNFNVNGKKAFQRKEKPLITRNVLASFT